MSSANTTCWTLIRGAAAGHDADREAFARRYDGIVRGYLAARWRGSALLEQVDDAVQEVFVESFREGGVLESIDDDRPGGFRAFYYGVVRNVARRFETKQARSREASGATAVLDGPASEAELSRLFDRTWAQSVMREAGALLRARSSAGDERARRRIDLLRLRFADGRPIREIAEMWEEDPTHLHREYALARREFHAALRDVVAFHHPGPAEEIERESEQLLEMLG